MHPLLRNAAAVAFAAGAAVLAVCTVHKQNIESSARANRVALIREAKELHDAYGRARGADVPRKAWRPAVAAFEPERVWVDDTGVYIALEVRFVEESGIFIRLNRNFLPAPGGDPAFTRIDADLYWFEVRG